MYSVLGSSIMLYSVCLAVSLFVCLPVCVRDSSVSELHVLCLSVCLCAAAVQFSGQQSLSKSHSSWRGGGGGGVAVGVAKGRRKVTVAPDINTQEQSSAGE